MRRLPGRCLGAGGHAGSADPVSTSAYLLERAWVDGAVHDDVLVEIEDGRFTRPHELTPGRQSFIVQREFHRPTDETLRLPGLTLPGLANCHSHAFHRALRGRTQRERGHVLDLARADVRRGGAARPGQLLRARPGDLPRDGGGRDHQRGRVPLPAPPARRHAVRRPQRDGPRAGRWQRRRPASGSRCWTPATCRAGSASSPRASRSATPTATPPGGPSGSGRSTTPTSARPSTRSARSRATSSRPSSRRRPGRPLHVHLSEQVAENDACLATYGVTPDPAAARRRRPRPADHRRARHPPHRRRHHPPRPERDPVLLLPDHRARPRRRHRPRPCPPPRRQPDHPRLRQPRRDRPVRGDARPRARRAARHPAARATGRPPSCWPPAPPTTASASPTPGGSPSGSAPTWSPSTPRPPGPPAPAPTRPPRSSPRPPPTSPTSSSTAASSRRATTTRRSAASSPPRSRGSTA